MPEQLIVASVAAGIARKKLTESETELMAALNKAKTVEVVVPEDIKPDEFRVALSAVCKNLVRAEFQKETLYPVLGQLMLVAKNHPDLWQTKAIENYEGFIAATADEFGVSRSTLLEARLMIERWGPVVSMQDFQMIGRSRLKTCSSVVPRGAEKEKTARKLLGLAATGTVQEMDRFIEANYHKSRPERIGSVFEIPCNKEQEHRWARFFNDPHSSSWVGSEVWADKMDAMMMECEPEWRAGAEYKMKEKANGSVVLEGEIQA